MAAALAILPAGDALAGHPGTNPAPAFAPGTLWGTTADVTQQGARAAATSSDPPLRVYVLVLDGLRPQEVGLRTPTLQRLRQEGTWYEQARSVLPGETIPNHGAMMTGVVPGRSGIVANQIWRGRSQKEYMHFPEFFEVDTLVTRLERAYAAQGGISTATILSKLYLYGLFRGETGGTTPQIEADFHWDPRTAAPRFIIDPSAHAVDQATMEQLTNWFRAETSGRPQFALVNLGDIDRAGHADEGGVPLAEAERRDDPYRELSGDHISPFRQGAIETTDSLIGSFVDELKREGAWDETVLILASDHGMDWGMPNRVAATTNTLSSAGYTLGENRTSDDADYWSVGGGGTEAFYVHHRGDIEPIARKLAQVPGVDYVATAQRFPGLDNPTFSELGIDHPYSGDIVAFLEPGWRSSPPSSGVNPLPGNHGHSVTQHSALLVTGGHPLLRDAPDRIDGPAVYDETRASKYADPGGGPGNLSITPTVAALFGVGAPAGGFDAGPLTAAFDPGVFQPAGGAGSGGGGSGSGTGAGPGSGGSASASALGRLVTTLTASRRALRYGQGVVLSGRVVRPPACTGTLRVTLRHGPHGAAAARLLATSVPVRADGRWSQRVVPRANAFYTAITQPTATCEGTSSAPVPVAVRARVLLERARDCRTLRGRVLPAAPRSVVVLERRRGGRYRRVASRRLDRASRFRFRLPSCASSYRVAWRGGRSVSAGDAIFRARGRR